jgi:predicted nucleotidyltransferase/biotin operon repressor
MEIYKLKFTKLQQEILRFLFVKNGMSFNQRALSKNLKISPTAVAKSIKLLIKEGLIDMKKNKESKTTSIKLNTENSYVFDLKRAENLKMLYESGITGYLSEEYPEATIILFGSFSFGEDTINSDIDIAVIGSKDNHLNLEKFEKIFGRKIYLQFYPTFKDIQKNLKENLYNGILLKGGIRI